MVTLFDDIFDEVGKVIKSWKPRGCKTEKDYEKRLIQKLEKELPKRNIQKQIGSGRQRVDIVVDDKLAIEIKKDLDSTGAYHRLIGQLDQYLKKWSEVFVVLCGETDRDMHKSLQKYANSKASVLSGWRIKIFKV